jgi:hypothetical protein
MSEHDALLVDYDKPEASSVVSSTACPPSMRQARASGHSRLDRRGSVISLNPSALDAKDEELAKLTIGNNLGTFLGVFVPCKHQPPMSLRLRLRMKLTTDFLFADIQVSILYLASYFFFALVWSLVNVGS